MTEREVIDVDDLDLVCTGVRHCVRIDRPPSPRLGKRVRIGATPQSASMSELQRITQQELQLRIHDPPPLKKRATDALKMAAIAVNNHRNLKRKQVMEVIEISDDSDSEILPPKRQKVDEHVQSPHDTGGGSPMQKFHPEQPHDAGAGSALTVPQKVEEQSRNASGRFGDIPKPEPESRPSSPSADPRHNDDDDDCMNLLASLDISNDANWVPLPERNRAEDLTPIHESDSDPPKPHSLPPFRIPRKKPPIDHRHVPVNWFQMGPWGVIARNYGITKFPKPFFPAQRQDCVFSRCTPNLYYERGYSKLELTAKYPHLTSGSVNKIIQGPGAIVLCAVVDGGVEDDDDEEDATDRPPPPHENRPGSLIVYHNGRAHTAGHCRPRDTSRGSVMKYYTVSDVAFNPFNPRQFLSAGHDLLVRTWEILDDDDVEHNSVVPMHQFGFDSRPQDLVYTPDGSTLAITCVDGTVRLYSQDLFEDMTDAHYSPKKLPAAPRGSGHATGVTLWGAGPSKGFLFTSSEPEAKDNYNGFHHAFDTRRGQAFKLDATEAGDAAAVSPDGTTLALFTRGENNTHPIRLYDVGRKAKDAYETEELEKFHVRPVIGSNQGQDDSEEVTQASFSPDGRLLAVARSDNALHVYDLRALSRGPLCQYEHHPSDHVGGGGFGIVAVNWIQGRSRLGLASGGNDGCVRLWEPALGRNELQGTVLGRTDFDVGHFCMGDRQNGEHPLIIGDSGGGMHTYGFTNPDGVPI